MKSLSNCLFACGWTLTLVACSAGNDTPAPQKGQSAVHAPAAPGALATKTAKATPRPTTPEVQTASAFSFESTKHAEPAAPPREPRKRRAVQSDDLRGIASRGLLRWLPLDSWAVLRVPHVELLGELPSRCGMASLFRGPLAALAIAGPDSPLGQMQQRLHAEAPELDRLIELLPGLHGELVVALENCAPGAKSNATTPLTAALVYSSTSEPDAIRDVLDAYLGRLQKQDAQHVQKLDGAWGYRVQVADATIELRRTGDVYTAVYSTASEPDANAQPTPERAPAESFAASSVVLSSPDLNAGDQGVVEIYVNAAPGLELARSLAPDDVEEVFTHLGVWDIDGLSFAMSLAEKGVSEALTWCAPGHADIVSRAFAGKPANRKLARWIPADATTAGLYSVDVAGVFDAIAKSMPEKDAADMARGLTALKTSTGIDVYQDVIQNVGPSLAIVSRGDPLALMNGLSGMCFVFETKSDEKAQHLLDALVATLPPSMHTKTTQVAGQSVRVIDLSAMGVALSSISWCRADGALLIATDAKMLERCLSAGQTEGVKQPDLAAALANEDVIGAGLCAAVGDLPKTLTVLRKHENGFTLSSANGSGSMGGGSVAVLPLLAGVAIPRLMTARTSANEAAAIATLRNISSAEAQTQSAGVIDLDNDGVGEYGFLPEMAGTIALRGTHEKLDPPVLAPAMGVTQNGVLTRSGYMFQLWLPAARGNGGLCESKAKDGKDVNVDGAETSFVGYGWPARNGGTGSHVWAVWSNVIYVCEDSHGKYSGAEHAPAFDAIWPAKKGVDPEAGKPYVGSDGLTWKRLE